MIFSNLFKEKWQSKNATTRLQAITELSSNTATEKTILIDLAETDVDKQIRINALSKINQFCAWLDASNNNDNAEVRAYSQQKVEDIILGKDVLTLDQKEKFAFLEQQPQPQLLEKWLFHETNANLQITLYELINKPQLALKLFTKTDNTKVKNYIVEQSNDIALLEKLVKKAQSDEVTNHLTNKISELTLLKEKPLKLVKDIQLTLAKYLALKDVVNYQDMLIKKEAITTRWQTIKSDFELLSHEQQTTFDAKWQLISEQLLKIFAIKAEDYHQQQIAQKLAQEKQVQHDAFNAKVKQLNQQISIAIYENTPIDKEHISQLIDQQLQALAASVLDSDSQQQIATLFAQERQKLLQLDLIAESITQATHLISQLSQVALPQSVEQYTDKINFYHQWQSQWATVNEASCHLLPESITASYQQLTSQWQEANLPFEQTLKRQFKKVKSQFADVKRLINSGKYNASFGVFKKAEKSYLLLTEQQQQGLAKDYLWCQEKINELSDWESYIATPKKQALLLEAQTLAKHPLASPVEQAHKIKSFRKLWNSLGHAQADLEQELNIAFNLACEEAFAPCRLFYSEQDKLRAQHLLAREQLISQSQALATAAQQPDIDWKKLDSDLNKLLQQWRNAGDVDKQQYQRLNQTFTHLLKPVKQAIYSYHQDNAAKKQALIAKAQLLAQLDDKEQASQEIKRLQGQWREIGYSGPKHENKLWKAFRAVNDDIFAMRKKRQQSIVESNNALLAELSLVFQELVEKAEASIALQQIKPLIDEVETLKTQLLALRPHSGDLHAQSSALIKKLTTKENVLLKEKADQSWLLLFEVLKSATEQGIELDAAPNFAQLNNKWKKQLKAIPTTEADSNSRREKTIALELISGVKPPQSDQALTMNIQVKLMQQQLSQKELVTLEDAFCQWLALGRLSHNDLPLLERITPLFVK